MEQAEIERMLEALNEWEHADAGERVDCFVTLASKKPCQRLEKHIPDN